MVVLLTNNQNVQQTQLDMQHIVESSTPGLFVLCQPPKKQPAQDDRERCMVQINHLDLGCGQSHVTQQQSYCRRYMSNRKNPGNTKYVFDGHWFMEIDGNC